MLCHSQSSTCRLATNPGSITCSPATTTTTGTTTTSKTSTASASKATASSEETGAGTTKGGQTGYYETDETDKTKQASITATLSDKTIFGDGTTNQNSNDQDQNNTSGGNFASRYPGLTDRLQFIPAFFAQVESTLTDFFSRFFPGVQTIFIWIGFIALGILLLILSLIFALTAKKRHSTTPKVVTLTPEEKAAQIEAQRQLQSRISALQATPANPNVPVNRPPVIQSTQPTQAPQPTQPVATQPKPVTQPVPTPQAQPQQSQTVFQSSSMLEKIKQKGLAVPHVSSSAPTTNTPPVQGTKNS